ncbi:probable 4-coumarate--CoA ligase 1 [Folsomia candida]|nr:probable 4-coumarate--CoA ligase 1 [Folsomia candida]
MIAILLPNIPEYAAILLGILQVGATVSPFNPNYIAPEIATQLTTCRAKLIVTIPQLLPLVKEARRKNPFLKSVVVVGEAQEGCHTYSEMIKVSSEGVQLIQRKDIDTRTQTALLPWSSGTTGPPKGVMLTHFSVSTNLYQFTQPGYLGTQEGGNGQGRLIGILPFFHIYGFAMLLGLTLYQGHCTMTMVKFEPNVFIDTLRRHKPTYLFLVPPLMTFLVSQPDVSAKEFESVTGIMAAAAPVGPVVTTRLLEKIEKRIIFQEGYGMTELAPVSHLTPVTPINGKIGSTGIVIPGTHCKIVSIETGEPMGPGERGEICVKGPQVMKGYFENEKATKETIDSDGWLHTGDIGLYDEDKYFFIVDRLKELIKVSGYQVAPSELEDLLRKHPAVADVAVIGVPDERAGEFPRAYIVLKPSSNPSAEEIHKFIEDKVSCHKKLKGGVEFIKAIPKSATGKILRRELKKDYMAKH